MSGQSDSPFRRFFAKTKALIRPRRSLQRHTSRSTESLPPTLIEHLSVPLQNANAASYECLPARPPTGRTQVYHAKPQETESLPRAVARERTSKPLQSANSAFSDEYLSAPPRRTQVHHADRQGNERETSPKSEYISDRIESRVPAIVRVTGGDTALVSRQFLGTRATSSHQFSSTTLAATPWESWKLDQDFLSQVYTWNADHPENTLDRILNKTATLIGRHDVLLELVPDGPIPFRGFVKALAHLVKLGTTVAEAKAVALRFAQDVLHWVEKLATAFGVGEGGPFVAKAWANLADIRKLIEEVCTWAHGMLKKSRLAERISVKNTLMEFRDQFSQAIERFAVVSHIHIAIGQDHLNQHLHGLTVGQGHMNQELVAIRRALAQKPQSTLPDATYQIQKKIPCDPGTRKQVLNDIMKWIFDISEGSPCFFWLSGDPGVGKSAVTASIARECAHRNVLWAQYFINRNDAHTVDPQLYFPSIAKQMAACAQAVDHAVQKTLRDHPYLISDDISLDQATKLFVDTNRVAAASTPTMPVAVVIDALDETDHKRLKVTADIFSRVLVDLPHNAKVFISSRVETVIRDKFSGLPRVYNIHLSARNSIADVTAYLEAKVNEIMVDHHISRSQWGQDRMQKLCSQASGLFVWAVTAIKYIQAQIEDFGKERLDMILDELNFNGMQDINTLYITILKRTYQRDTPWQNQCFRRIVGAILVQQTPLSIDDLTGLLGLHNPTNKSPVDVEHFVRRLRTILAPGVAEITGHTIPRVHKSFSDFITSARAEEFRVNLIDSNGELALKCIDRLERLWQGEMPGQLRYAISHWSSHLTQVVGIQEETLEAEVDDTSSDAHSLISDPDKNPGTSVSVEQQTQKYQPLPGQGRTFSINVSQDGSQILYARGQSILLRDIETGSFIQRSFNGHTKSIYRAIFSPDASNVVSASADKTVCIWNTTTGSPVGRPLKCHTLLVYSAFFSPDARQIVSTSTDHTICICDAETQQLLRTLQGHRDTVDLAVFSPDGKHIVSSSQDRTVRIWDATTGTAVRVLEGHTMPVQFAIFSPDGKKILSSDNYGKFIAWDFETGQRLPEYFAGSNPTLSFTSSDTAAYITTPTKPFSPAKEGPNQSSYSFRVGEKAIAGGVHNAWIYTQPNQFTMTAYLGQLIICAHLI